MPATGFVDSVTMSDYCIRTPDRPSAPMCMFGPRRKRSPCTIMHHHAVHAAMPPCSAGCRTRRSPQPARLRTARVVDSVRGTATLGGWAAVPEGTCSGVNELRNIRPPVRIGVTSTLSTGAAVRAANRASRAGGAGEATGFLRVTRHPPFTRGINFWISTPSSYPDYKLSDSPEGLISGFAPLPHTLITNC